MDHIGCNDVFSEARLVAHPLEDPPIGTLKVDGPMKILPGVELIPTPGHSRGSLSVLVEAEKRYAIVGDAIPTRSNFEQRVPPFINFDRALAVRSMEMILDWAEVIVPGHDSPFEVRGK
jgi:glyoxylase-like metal-dependent hydrolase (beta-lactamase superfamily II)